MPALPLLAFADQWPEQIKLAAVAGRIVGVDGQRPEVETLAVAIIFLNIAVERHIVPAFRFRVPGVQIKRENEKDLFVRSFFDPVEGNRPVFIGVRSPLGIDQGPEKIPGLPLMLGVVNFCIEREKIVAITNMVSDPVIAVKREVVAELGLVFNVLVPEVKWEQQPVLVRRAVGRPVNRGQQAEAVAVLFFQLPVKRKEGAEDPLIVTI